MRLPMNVFLFIGLISGAIAGGLIEYVLGFILPKKPKYTHFIAIGIAIIVFTSISIWPNISGENPGKEAQQISIVDDELKFALRVHTVQIIGDYFDINGKGTFSFHTNMIPTNGNWFYGTYPYPGMYYEKESAQILRMDDFNISLPGIKSDTIVYLIFLTFAEDRNSLVFQKDAILVHPEDRKNAMITERNLFVLEQWRRTTFDKTKNQCS